MGGGPMSDDETVGYRKPPRQHQFKRGNKAASKNNRQAKKKANAIALPEIIERALRTKRKVRRGDRVYSVSAAEILAERLVQMMTTGSAREVAIVMQLIEKHLPDAMARPTEVLEIMHHHAEGSCIQPPPEDLWEKDK